MESDQNIKLVSYNFCSAGDSRMSGLKATAEEILGGIKRSISSLETGQVEKMIDMITDLGDRKILSLIHI